MPAALISLLVRASVSEGNSALGSAACTDVAGAALLVRVGGGVAVVAACGIVEPAPLEGDTGSVRPAPTWEDELAMLAIS